MGVDNANQEKHMENASWNEETWQNQQDVALKRMVSRHISLRFYCSTNHTEAF